jgi:large subunit ribosomal protein L14
MIQVMSKLTVADNSGAKLVRCIGMQGIPKVASIGRLLTVSIREAKPGGKVKPGEKYKALLVRCRKEWARPDGRWIRFEDNACVLLGTDLKPVGSRIVGPVPLELRRGNWLRVLGLSARQI